MPLKISGSDHVVLSPAEHAAIMDRLSLPENIAEALTDVADGDEPPVPESHEAVAARVEILARLVGGTDRTIPPLFTDLDRAILVEAVEGSTYAAGTESHETQRLAARVRTLRALARKMVAAGIADEINIPTS